jgi:hypothetical protein
MKQVLLVLLLLGFGRNEGLIRARTSRHIDGVLNDGGVGRQYGWGRIGPALGEVNGLQRVTMAPALYGEVQTLHIYDSALRTLEPVGNFRAGSQDIERASVLFINSRHLPR